MLSPTNGPPVTISDDDMSLGSSFFAQTNEVPLDAGDHGSIDGEPVTAPPPVGPFAPSSHDNAIYDMNNQCTDDGASVDLA